MPVAVDTNVLVGSALKRDQYNRKATEILRRLDTNDTPVTHVNNYVVAETMNLVGERAGKETAIEIYDSLVESAGFERMKITEGDFSRGEALFRKYDRLTFVDSITVAYMRREGIEYLYSFDDDFDGIDGVTRLDEAVAPD